MAAGKQKSDWTRHSHLLAMIYNSNVGKKSDMLQPSDFDPFAEKPEQLRVGVEYLKSILIKE